MGQRIDLDAWREIFFRAFSQLGENLVAFLPNLLGAALILFVGWLLARGLEAIASRALRGLGIDRVSRRVRLAELLERAEIRLTPSEIVAKLLFWLLLLTFVVSSVETLGLRAVTSTIDRLIAFIPNVIGAVLIAIAGLFLARLAGTLVSSGAAAAGMDSAPRLGFVAQIAVGALVLVVAIEPLGIDTRVLVLPLSVALAAAGFAVGLAFALGAGPVVTHIMAGHFLKQSLPRDRAVEIDGRRGRVERVGPVDTLLRGDEHSWSVPNAELLNRIVVR